MTKGNTPSVPAGPAGGSGLSPARISFRYSSEEDRIVGVFEQGELRARVLLTRRLVRQLIARLVLLLERSSQMAGRAPAMMRAEVVQFEHQNAVAQLVTRSGSAAGKSGGATANDVPALLITRVNLTPLPSSAYTLALRDERGRSVTLRMHWQDLHRLVAALHQKARGADWDLADAAPWLEGPAKPSASRS